MITNQTLSFFNVFNLALTYRRATPLLERCRELAGRRGARGAATRAVPGRDQRHAGIGVAAVVPAPEICRSRARSFPSRTRAVHVNGIKVRYRRNLAAPSRIGE